MLSSKHFRKSPKFSIEDAFEEDADDAIRLYGAVSERSPLRPANELVDKDGDIEIRVQDPLIDTSINISRLSHQHQGFLPLPTDGDSVSRDSDSLIPGDNIYRSDSFWFFSHPKIREKWQIVAGAFTLFILGSVLIVTGVVIEVIPIESLSGFVFLVAGLICFIPGVYHVVFIILAVQGRQGYDFYSLPLFN